MALSTKFLVGCVLLTLCAASRAHVVRRPISISIAINDEETVGLVVNSKQNTAGDGLQATCTFGQAMCVAQCVAQGHKSGHCIDGSCRCYDEKLKVKSEQKNTVGDGLQATCKFGPAVCAAQCVAEGCNWGNCDEHGSCRCTGC